MPISVNPILPVIAAQPVAPELVLQPGTVVDAQVLKLLSDDLVRIAIAGLSIDVLSEIPLVAGQVLHLAVAQTADGISLAVVGQNSAAGKPADTVAASSGPAPDGIANAPAVAAPAKNQLTPLERVAVTAAAESAATQQESLAPLFANLGVAAGSDGLPAKLQQAVLQVLAQRTSLDQNLSGGDVKTAFQKSGLFLEDSLASALPAPATGVPDLKAALIVLRQTLVSALGAAAPPSVAQPQPVSPASVVPQQPVSAAVVSPADVAAAPTLAPSLAPSLAPGLEQPEIPLPPATTPVAVDALEPGNPVRIVLPETLLNAGPRSMTSATVLNLLQETMQAGPRLVGSNASLPVVTQLSGRGDDVTFHTNTPPPPFRGALPSAQPIAMPLIAPNAPLAITAHHLLADTDAAIARQTLLQVASLPDRADGLGVRSDPAVPRWSFEIPFVTPQGTAMAQFEISRDGGGNETEAAKRIWRARFSLDVEPAGPVHALVSLSGERTSVRMWAERPATAAQLRAGTAQLSQALSKAALTPGDIVVRDGTPPQPTPAPAGHFLDRAL